MKFVKTQNWNLIDENLKNIYWFKYTCLNNMKRRKFEEIFYGWLDKVFKNENPNIILKFFNKKEEFVILKRKKEYLKRFKKEFSNLSSKNKKLLLTVNLNSFPKEILEMKNLKAPSLVKMVWKNLQECYEVLEREKFVKKYSYNFKDRWHVLKEFKTFENFENFIKNKKWLKTNFEKFEYYKLTKEQFLYLKEKRKFLDYFKSWFARLSLENKNILIKYWFDKLLKRKYYLKKEHFIKYFHLNKKQYLKEIERKKFLKIFWKWFSNRKEKILNKIYKLWFNKVLEILKEKYWLKTKYEKLNFIFETKEKFLFYQFWEKYGKWFSKSNNYKLKKFFIENLNWRNIKYRWKWMLKIFLFETKNNFIFDVNNSKIICPLCKNHLELSECELIRMKNTRNPWKICTKCNPKIKATSLKEDEFYEKIKSFYQWEIIRNSKKLLWNWKEIDIYLPREKIAIEYNWSFWHHNKKDNLKLEKCIEKWMEFFVAWEHTEEEDLKNLKDKIFWKEFTEDEIIVENKHYQKINWYEKVWEIPQTFEMIGNYKIWDLGKTIWKKV